MWSLAVAIYAACKWLTWRRTTIDAAPIWMQAGYLLAWPGLDAGAFLAPRASVVVPRPELREWLVAVGKCAAGLAILFAVTPLVPAIHPMLAGWVGMVGIVVTLHFGIFHLLSCLWRRAGVEARPLMLAPLRSTSLSEFWGRRWNTAFRDLTHRFLFRPIASRWGARQAILAGFLFSGVAHDLVISVPAGGGYGGPTVFFTVQGVAMLAERSPIGRKAGLGHGVRGWIFTMVVLIAPVGLLFHRPFVLTIIAPFLHAIGALP
jgi:alginate O-acetyltransferase complex protein AlgI